ncbi:MAG: DUF4129 domain-containing protein [Hymenobacter sp.]
MRRLPLFFLPVLLLAAGPAPAQRPSAWHRPWPSRAPTPARPRPYPPPRRPWCAARRRPACASCAASTTCSTWRCARSQRSPAFWQRLLAWLWRQLAGTQETKGGRVAWDVFFYGLLAAVLVFAVLKLLQVDITRAFGRAPRGLPLAYEVGQENIHELNFSEAIAQAEATGNRRLALRLGYLQLLKQLTDRDFIAWQPDKTNQTYLRELAASHPAACPAFAELTRQFDYSWYGELPSRPTFTRRRGPPNSKPAGQLARAAPGRPQPA